MNRVGVRWREQGKTRRTVQGVDDIDRRLAARDFGDDELRFGIACQRYG